jgi:hypothetical protein
MKYGITDDDRDGCGVGAQVIGSPPGYAVAVKR